MDPKRVQPGKGQDKPADSRARQNRPPMRNQSGPGSGSKKTIHTVKIDPAQKNPPNLAPLYSNQRLSAQKLSRSSSASQRSLQNAYQQIENDTANYLNPKTIPNSKGVTPGGTRTTSGAKSRSGKSWRDEKDPLYVYKMDKYFEIGDDQKTLIEENSKWRSQDIKGKRKTFYIKEVTRKNDHIMNIAKQDRLEKLKHKTDRWPCLNARKMLEKLQIYITMAAEAVIDHRSFETTSIVIIMLNCVTLAMEDPTKAEVSDLDNTLETIFQVLYTIEMVLKIVGKGFVLGKDSYLRDPWNVLDFIIVMSAYLTLFQSLAAEEEVTNSSYGEEEEAGLSLQSLRAFRVLRPLRAVTGIRGLKLLVQSALTALEDLKNTIMVLMFFFIIFAIGGVNLFSGMLKLRCVSYETGREFEVPDYFCGGEQQCPDGYFCGKMNRNPNFGVTNFDNIFWALLTVFQCISLEGWSDVMVMYQKVYTRFVFFFFFLVVLLGAFFLLNLTLAVINGAFVKNQKKLKDEEAREQAERNQFKVKKSSDEVILDNLNNQEQNKANEDVLGLKEFVIAHRTAQRMREWFLLTRAAKANQGDDGKQEQQQLMEPIEDKGGMKELGLLKTSSTPSLAPGESPLKFNKSLGAIDLDRTEVKQSKTKFFQPDVNLGPVNETKAVAEDDNHSDNVAKFLEYLERDGPAQYKTMEPPGESKKIGPMKPSKKEREKELMMAYIESGRATPDQYNSRAALTKTIQQHSLADLQNQSLHFADKGLRKVQSITRILDEHLTYEKKRKLDDESILHKELDFEKVIPAEHQGEIGKKALDKGVENSVEEQQSFDLSFDHIMDQYGYISDGGDKIKERRSLDDLEESAIQTDLDAESFGDPQDRGRTLGQPVQLMMRNSGQGRNQQLDELREEKRLKRNRTMNFSGREDPMNQTGQSTMYVGGNDSVQHEMISKDNIRMKNSASAMLSDKKSTKQGDAKSRNKQQALDIYKKIDDTFIERQPKDPHKIIESDFQKIGINPGVPYISTSQDAVFEIRNAKNQMMLGRSVNKFIAIKRMKEEDDDSGPERIYVRPQKQPYQLKNCYKIVEQKHEELDGDSDDEDALINVKQPFDTITNIGFKDMLTHLETKYLARRSDIIVSSTLSITLTPEVVNGKLTCLGLIAKEDVKNWIDKRNAFRTLEVKNAIIPKRSLGSEAATTEHDDSDDSSVSIVSLERKNSPTHSVNQTAVQDSLRTQRDKDSDESDEGSPRQENPPQNQSLLVPGLSTMPQVEREARRKVIPNHLLSEELPDRKISLMTRQEKKQYTIQLEKYKGKQDTLKKQQHAPKERAFKMEEALKLEEGTLWEDEDDEDERADMQALEKANNDKVNKAVYLNRDNLENELKLEQFEDALAIVRDGDKKEDNKANQKKDAIPEEVRKELGLPLDMMGFEIDFNEVRVQDSFTKRRLFIWSGQCVLQDTLDQEMSAHVVSYLNKTRIWPKFGFGYVKKARCLLKMLVQTSFFENFMTFCVLANTIVMAMDKYGQDKETEAQLNQYNSIFTWIFIVEMCLKLLAIGPKKYVVEPMNILDGTCVLLSVVELTIGAMNDEEGGGSLSAFRTVRVFRTFRVLRVARLLRFLKSMATIVGVITRTIGQFFYIIILLLLFDFIFALLGMQIFGGQYDFGDELKSRANYDSFWIAYVTVFQLLTMENWHFNMYESMRTRNPKVVTGVYYIAWIFIGNFVILNLLLSVIMDGFAAQDQEEQEEEDIESQKNAEARLAAKRAKRKAKARRQREERMRRNKSRFQSGSGELGKTSREMLGLSPRSADLGLPEKPEKKTMTGARGAAHELDQLIDELEDLDEREIVAYLKEAKVIKVKDPRWYKRKIDATVQAENALYCFHRRSKFRLLCYNVQKHKYFDRFIMTLIFLSSLKLATDTYMNDLAEDSAIIKVSEITDSTFTWLFFGEFIIKIIALGFAMDAGSYVRDSWNQLDFFIVLTSMIDFALGNVEIPFIKILRLLRTLRPLRVVSHSKSLRLIVAALFTSAGAIVNVSVVIAVVWLMFGIYGINTYKGAFFYCSEDKYFYHLQQTCEEAGHTWQAYDSNFDNIGNAMMTLFVVSSLEGWPDIMYQALDVVGYEKGPKFENQTYQAIFFILFILVGCFFFLQSFIIGTLQLEYLRAKEQEEKGYTQEMLAWIEIQQMIISARPDHVKANMPSPTATPWRHYVWVLTGGDDDKKIFDNVIMICIVLNMLQMALSYEGAPQSWESVLEFSNYVFTTIFLVECVLKLFAYQRAYFYTNWNRFDFFVVVSSLLDIGLKFLPSAGGESDNQVLTVGPQLARVLRVLRVSRVLRLSKHNKGLQSLLETITKAFPAIMNVFGLLMLIFFMEATLGVFFFSTITEGEVINRFKNFSTWDDAFLLLFAMATGEEWNLVMFDCSKVPPNCTEGVDCGSSWAWAYFLAFVVLVSHIMLNLFVLIIIEQFDKYDPTKENPVQTYQDMLAEFESKWVEKTDKYRCEYLKEGDLITFYKSLGSKIGLPNEPFTDAAVKKILLKMGIKVHQSDRMSKIYFNELLYRLMREKFVNFKLNKRMAMNEVMTQYKIYQLTQKDKNKNLQSGKSFAGSLKSSDSSVNPFMRQIFYRLSFKTWHSHMIKEEKKKRIRQQKSDAGVTVTEEELEKYFPDQFEEVEVLLSPDVVEYTTEEDELLSISKPARTGAGSISDSIGEDGEKIETLQDRTPAMHRRRTRVLKAAVLQRFQSSYIPSPTPKPELPSPAKLLKKKLSYEVRGVPISSKAVR